MERQRILLVDDEPGLLDICREVLTDRGYDVFTASNGRRALPILQTGDIDCAVLDQRMPEMDGMELMREITRLGLHVEVIFLTGYGCVDHAVECLQLGAVDYMLKPFVVDELAARVEKALQERQMRAPDSEGTGLLAVYGLAEALQGPRNFDSLLREFLRRVLDAFAPEGLVFFPHQADESSAVSVNGSGLPATLGRWCSAVAERVARGGAPRLLDSAGLSAARAAGRPVPRELDDASLLFAPLRNGAHCLGTVVLLRRGTHAGYTVNDLRLLSFLAAHAAAVLDSSAKHRQIEDINMGVITSFVRAVEAKDPYTCGHSERVSEYAVRLGRTLGLGESALQQLRIAGLLHDIGKIGVPDSILNKPGALSDEERAVMRRHPTVGREILGRVASLQDILPIVYHHHERMDGEGYPDGLSGAHIPLLSRIVSVVDGFEAMVSDRAYREGMDMTRALDTLRSGAGSQWDERLVEAWIGLAAGGGADLSSPV